MHRGGGEAVVSLHAKGQESLVRGGRLRLGRVVAMVKAMSVMSRLAGCAGAAMVIRD